MKEAKYLKGQYFTTNDTLKTAVYDLIKNDPQTILEPSVGHGDLVEFVRSKKQVDFDCYEIDDSLELLETARTHVTYCDFLKQPIDRQYTTIIGNPPYVKTKYGNLYRDFIKKCFGLLEENGELIFIVPSDFIKLTSSCKLINEMLQHGTFTHITHPNNEKLFSDASIDVIVFRYCKNKYLPYKTLVNGFEKFLINTSGILTFTETPYEEVIKLDTYFDVSVGMVSGKESVFKNDQFGNIELLNGKGKTEKYIMLDDFPTLNQDLDEYMNQHKSQLINRKIKKFTENNWWDWGAKRNINKIKDSSEQQCIYLSTLSRKKEIAFVGKVQYFGGGLLLLIPKRPLNLDRVVEYLNSDNFKRNYLYSGRFKIGHKQLCNCLVDKDVVL